MNKFWLIGIIALLLCSFNAMATHISHNVSAVKTTTGTNDGGNITSFYFLNTSAVNNTYNVSEVGGIPGFDVRMNFTNVTENMEVYFFYLYAQYDGHAGHLIRFEIYNFSNSNWTKMTDIDLQTSLTWYNTSVTSQDYISSNVMWVRTYHYSSGSASDDIYFEYLVLTEGHNPPIDEVFESAKCPIDDTPTAMIFIFIGMLFVSMFIIGMVYATMPIFNMIIGLGMLFYSFPIWGCNMIFGAVITIFGVMMMGEAVIRWRTGR